MLTLTHLFFITRSVCQECAGNYTAEEMQVALIILSGIMIFFLGVLGCQCFNRFYYEFFATHAQYPETKGMPPPPYQRNNLSNPAPGLISSKELTSSQLIASNLMEGNFIRDSFGDADGGRLSKTGSVMGSNLILTSSGLINYSSNHNLSTIPHPNLSSANHLKNKPLLLVSKGESPDKFASRQVSFEDENGFMMDGANVRDTNPRLMDQFMDTANLRTTLPSSDGSSANGWKKVRALSKVKSLDKDYYQDTAQVDKTQGGKRKTRNQRSLTIQLDERRTPSPINQCQVHPKRVINSSVSLDIEDREERMREKITEN